MHIINMLWRVIVLVLLAMGGVSGTVQAQVYEISDSGNINVRDGGGAVAWHDAQTHTLPIARPIEGSRFFASSSPILFNDTLKQTAARHALSPALLEAVVWQESRWHSQAVSPKGAVGLTQLMPATARALGVNPRDPVANLDGGAHYLQLLLAHFNGNLEKSLAAYNAGVSRVETAGGIPNIRETKSYVSAIMGRLNAQVR